MPPWAQAMTEKIPAPGHEHESPVKAYRWLAKSPEGERRSFQRNKHAVRLELVGCAAASHWRYHWCFECGGIKPPKEGVR